MNATTKTQYIVAPGKGSLFAKADKDTGELVSINGSIKLPERYGSLVVHLDGELTDTGAISLIGRVADHPRTPVHGLLMPKEYDKDFKGGELTIGKVTIKVNSKTVEDRNGEPYRFLWMTNNTVRAAC